MAFSSSGTVPPHRRGFWIERPPRNRHHPAVAAHPPDIWTPRHASQLRAGIRTAVQQELTRPIIRLSDLDCARIRVALDTAYLDHVVASTR